MKIKITLIGFFALWFSLTGAAQSEKECIGILVDFYDWLERPELSQVEKRGCHINYTCISELYTYPYQYKSTVDIKYNQSRMQYLMDEVEWHQDKKESFIVFKAEKKIYWQGSTFDVEGDYSLVQKVRDSIPYFGKIVSKTTNTNSQGEKILELYLKFDDDNMKKFNMQGIKYWYNMSQKRMMKMKNILIDDKIKSKTYVFNRFDTNVKVQLNGDLHSVFLDNNNQLQKEWVGYQLIK